MANSQCVVSVGRGRAMPPLHRSGGRSGNPSLDALRLIKSIEDARQTKVDEEVARKAAEVAIARRMPKVPPEPVLAPVEAPSGTGVEAYLRRVRRFTQ